MSEEKLFIIPDSIRLGLIAYLEQRPYREVAAGIAGLQRLRPIDDNPPPAPGKPE